MEPSQIAKGLVLLLPSRREKPRELFRHTAIPRHLASQGFITVVPDIDYALILEDRTIHMLNDIVDKESRKAGLTASPIIGGFSSGGGLVTISHSRGVFPSC